MLRKPVFAMIAFMLSLALFVLMGCAAGMYENNPPAQIMVRITNYSPCEVEVLGHRYGSSLNGIRVKIAGARRRDEPMLHAAFVRHSAFGGAQVVWRIVRKCGDVYQVAEARFKEALPNVALIVEVVILMDFSESTLTISPRE